MGMDTEMNNAEIMRNAMETYVKLKDKYLFLRALLNRLSVNLTDMDKIKDNRIAANYKECKASSLNNSFALFW